MLRVGIGCQKRTEKKRATGRILTPKTEESILVGTGWEKLKEKKRRTGHISELTVGSGQDGSRWVEEQGIPLEKTRQSTGVILEETAGFRRDGSVSQNLMGKRVRIGHISGETAGSGPVGNRWEKGREIPMEKTVRSTGATSVETGG